MLPPCPQHREAQTVNLLPILFPILTNLLQCRHPISSPIFSRGKKRLGYCAGGGQGEKFGLKLCKDSLAFILPSFNIQHLAFLSSSHLPWSSSTILHSLCHRLSGHVVDLITTAPFISHGDLIFYLKIITRCDYQLPVKKDSLLPTVSYN
jgi:hypothetical protein